MEIRRAAWSVLVSLVLAGCASPDAASPSCQDVASSFYNCGGLIPGMFGHDALWVADGPATDGTASKPVGCVVTLPYEDPAFPGAPLQCTCVNEGAAAENRANWHCAAKP